MKTKLLGFIGAAALCAAMLANAQFSNNEEDHNSAGISLARLALVATAETENTGPGEDQDCAGWGTGSKKICKSENQYPCTERDCE